MTTTVLSAAVAGGGVVNNAGTQTAGEPVTITLTMSAGVTVSGGVPTLVLNDLGTATYDAAKTAVLADPTKLVFDYTVATGENVTALAIKQVKLNGATIHDAGAADANLAGALTTFGGLKVDAVDPSPTFNNADPPLYVPNSTVHWTLTFTE